MGTAQAKAMALRLWEEGWNQGRLEVVDEVLAPDAVDRHSFDEEDFRAHLKGAIGEFRTGFPDLHAQVEDLVAEDDRLAMRVTITGTHTGPFFGTAPTGKPVSIEQYHFVQVNDAGQGIRHWANIGVEDLFRQLGTPPSGIPA
jgi:predicted ester cyclase